MCHIDANMFLCCSLRVVLQKRGKMKVTEIAFVRRSVCCPSRRVDLLTLRETPWRFTCLNVRFGGFFCLHSARSSSLRLSSLDYIESLYDCEWIFAICNDEHVSAIELLILIYMNKCVVICRFFFLSLKNMIYKA